MTLEAKLKNNSVPKILEQRLLINETHRKILGAIDELSPRDNSNLYMLDFTADYVPSIESIAVKTKLKAAEVRKNIQEIKSIWQIPDDLPHGRKKLNNEQSLIYALANQHRTRFDPNINDYRVKTIQILTGEVGAGMLYSRKDSFKGEEILRQAMGWNDHLTAYHLQGGHMPIIMQMYGKVKKERAKLVGTTEEVTQETLNELSNIIKHIEMSQSDISKNRITKLSEKDIEKLKKNVIGTSNTYSEAGQNAANELQYLFKNINPQTQIFIYSSYNDDANRDEINDLQVTKYRMAKDKADEAKRKLPKLEEEIRSTRIELGKEYVNLTLGERVAKRVEDKESRLGKDEDLPKGKAFREFLESIAGDYSKKESQIYTRAKRSFEKHAETKDEKSFEDAISSAYHRFIESSGITDKEEILRRIKMDEEKKNTLSTKLAALRDKREEYQMYLTAYETEVQEGHGWFTKKVAMNNTEAKGLWVVSKNIYKDIIEKDLFANIKKNAGEHLDLNYISDAEISVYIKDPAEAHGFPIKSAKHLPGKIVYSIPRVNRQMSNEPHNTSLFIAQKKHESAIAARLANPKEKPKTIDEFLDRKYHLLAYSDVVLTSHGAEGFQHMVKHAVGHTQQTGEYRGEIELVNYIKVPTRHDVKRISELTKKGNVGTWEAKRIEKGGATTGFAVLIHHPDDTEESIFVHDNVTEYVEKTYGESYRKLQSALPNAKKTEKTAIQNKLNDLYAKIREDLTMYNSLQANDLHFGAFNERNAPTNVDYIKASQIHIMQTYGKKNINVVTGTEFINGNQRWRSYDASLEGELEDPATSEINTNFVIKSLQEKFKKQGMKESDITKLVLEHVRLLETEKMYSKPTHRADDQLEIFRQIEWPIFMELLEYGIPIFLGTGNHWKAGTPTIDEATLIKNMFDPKYQYTGQLITKNAHGQSFTTAEITLPSKDRKINAVFTHKMWHGETEISMLSKQALGQKVDAQIYFIGDRHHPGFAVERERAFVLDTGKQSTMPYVMEIGKAPSTRGSVVFKYNPNGKQMYSTHFILDKPVDRIIKWDEKSKMLKECYDNIKESTKKAVHW
ncbi:MAG TPA: hypothetical protein VEC16_06615 [Alphaproteobacteria bacterium]|nr:hypothetical protein [Alphaproteobacteria bacterium]